MIQWLIKLGTPGWESATRQKAGNAKTWSILVADVLGIVLVFYCWYRVWLALQTDDYAQATFFMLLAFMISYKRPE